MLKTVTIYTDGGTARRAGMGCPAASPLAGQLAATDMQAPSEGAST
mgnify:CR=1 FL=1